MNKKVITINSIYDLDNALQPYKFNAPDGYVVYPDFELVYVEYGKYLLIIK